LLGPANVAGASEFSPQRLREEVAEILAQPAAELGEQENLLDRGLDSIRIMSLVERWRRQGAEVTFVELAERPTLTDWYALLSTQSTRAASATTR
ncbi:MAG: phosphopantetheine-binding protein, partial [Cystobacter sp.]